MSDDRPVVYREGDQVIFRGSGLDTCETALVGLLMGHDPVPFPKAMVDAFAFGHEHEQTVIDAFLAANPIFELVIQQQELDYEVAPGIVVRCHSDGVLRHRLTDSYYLLEIKTLGKSLLQAYLNGKLYDRIPGYKHQLDLYRLATGAALDQSQVPAIYVVMDKENFKAGYAPEHWLHVEYHTSPVKLDPKLVEKLTRVVSLAEAGAIPESECKGLCPTPYLHDGFEEGELVIDDELDELAFAYQKAKVEEEVAKLAKQEAGKALKKKLAQLGVDKAMTLASRVTLVTQSRSNLDKAAMKAAGIDPSQFEKKYSYDYVRVTTKGGSDG